MNFIVILLLVFLLFSLIRRNHHKVLVTQYRYELYALRDKLRQYVIEGKISKNEWAFKYLDSSISKMVSQLHTINLWTSMVLHIYYKNDERIIHFKYHLESSFKRYKALEKVYSEYGDLLVEYTIQRHITTLIITMLGIESVLKSIQGVRKFLKWFKTALLEQRESPQTSTIAQFSTQFSS